MQGRMETAGTKTNSHTSTKKFVDVILRHKFQVLSSGLNQLFLFLLKITLDSVTRESISNRLKWIDTLLIT